MHCEWPSILFIDQDKIPCDNAQVPSAQVVKQFLAKHIIMQVQHPTYSLDIVLCDFFLFPKLNIYLMIKRSEKKKEI